MDFRLKPKEEKFFLILNKHAELGYEASTLMRKAFKGEISIDEAYQKVRDMEHEADSIVLTTSEMLMKTFITPMDREDIQSLIEQLDDNVDGIKHIMDKMVIYKAENPTEGVIELAGVVEKALAHVVKAMSYMESLKKNHLKVEARAKKVSKIEEKGDEIYHREMALLFTECKDPIQVIKWKEILESMEEVINNCQKLVYTFRRVVLKYA